MPIIQYSGKEDNNNKIFSVRNRYSGAERKSFDSMLLSAKVNYKIEIHFIIKMRFYLIEKSDKMCCVFFFRSLS